MGIEVKRADVRRAQCSCSMPAVWWALSVRARENR